MSISRWLHGLRTQLKSVKFHFVSVFFSSAFLCSVFIFSASSLNVVVKMASEIPCIIWFLATTHSNEKQAFVQIKKKWRWGEYQIKFFSCEQCISEGSTQGKEGGKGERKERREKKGKGKIPGKEKIKKKGIYQMVKGTLRESKFLRTTGSQSPYELPCVT